MAASTFVLTGFALASEPPSAALLEDATSYAAQAGVTVDEAVRRLRLQQDIGDLDALLATEEPKTYAGLWIDDKDGYRVVARFTNPAAEARLRARIRGGKLANLVEMRPAKWSLEELRKRGDEVHGHAREGKIQADSDINVFENRAEIYVADDESKLHAAMARRGARMPEGVVVRRVKRLGEPTALTGGIPVADCTAGFTVQSTTGELGISTAGHCDNGVYVQGVHLPFVRANKEGPYDIQWHTACDRLQVTNQFQTGLGLRSVVATRHRNNQAVGTYVCKYGKVTGRNCGWIQSTSYKPSWTWVADLFGGTYIRVDGRGTKLVEEGDSGGPWYVADVAYGSTVGYVGKWWWLIGDEDAFYMASNYFSGVGVSVLTHNPGACNLFPVVNFTGGGRIDGTATFNASTSYDPDGQIVRYEWDFGDGTTGVSTTPYITHLYPPNSGAYSVTLTVTDNEGKRVSRNSEICVPALSCVNRPL